VNRIREDIRRHRENTGIDHLVMVNLASVERWPDRGAQVLRTLDAFERGLDGSDPAISPAMLYAYAAIAEGVPYGNFTPSLAADVPALTAMAERQNIPVAGKDGKTGQTFIKTVLAPAFRSRSLYVEGWFSTNILGNRDGLALDHPDSLRSKLNTKGSVLDDILGYPVEDHIVDIRYYRPRGDNKEAWDNIDLVGFLGQKMQIKVNFLCRDSILAAPLVIEIARVLDLARQRGQGGIQEQLGLFFKAPMTKPGKREEHSFPVQERALLDWLAAS
jgi:myo-inositol-1-phosphate synthase